MKLDRELAKMDDEMHLSMEIGHVMDLISQCLSPMEQLQCYLAAQQGFFYEVPIHFWACQLRGLRTLSMLGPCMHKIYRLSLGI